MLPRTLAHKLVPGVAGGDSDSPALHGVPRTLRWRAGRHHRGTAAAAGGALRGAGGSSAQIGAGAPGGGQQLLQALVTCGDRRLMAWNWPTMRYFLNRINENAMTVAWCCMIWFLGPTDGT